MTKKTTTKTASASAGALAPARKKTTKKAVKKTATQKTAAKKTAKKKTTKKKTMSIVEKVTPVAGPVSTTAPEAPATIDREISTGDGTGFIVLLGEEASTAGSCAEDSAAPMEPELKSSADTGEADVKASIGREVSLNGGAGFLVLLDEPASESGESISLAEDRILDLGSIATINEVEGIHASAMLLFRGVEPIGIRAERVDRVDTAVLQLLCSLCAEAKSRSVPIHWGKPSEVFCHAAARLDLTNTLSYE